MGGPSPWGVRGSADPLLEAGAVAGTLPSPVKANLLLARRLLLKLQFGFHEGFYDANILSTTLKILPLKTISVAQGPADCKFQGGKVPYTAGK